MKIDQKLNVTKCSKENLCDLMNEAIRSTNGSKQGFSTYMSIPRDAIVGSNCVTLQIGFVFKVRPDADEVGTMMIEYCPFCGAKFNAGVPE